MKSWTVIVPFDVATFAKRYGLDPFTDFSMNGQTLTVRPDQKITDDPPIFEPPDPPTDRLAALKTAIDAYVNRVAPPIDPALKLILQEWRKLL